MLALTRRVNEVVMLGDETAVTVTGIASLTINGTTIKSIMLKITTPEGTKVQNLHVGGSITVVPYGFINQPVHIHLKGIEQRSDRGGQARLGFAAPREIKILRLERFQAEKASPPPPRSRKSHGI